MKGKMLWLSVSFAVFALCCSAQDRSEQFETQNLTLQNFVAEGYILDIGGGGEGVIGQLKGSQVIAIDINKRELEEAPPGGLKIVMDARDLKFLDDTFNTATAFFTLMYIRDKDQGTVFQEVYRVLKSGGRFLIWDVMAPKIQTEDKDRFLVPLSITLPDRNIRTGYGARKPDVDHDLDYYKGLSDKTGFEVMDSRKSGRTFFLELIKP